MTHDHHPDPNHEAVTEAARMAAVIVSVVETMILVGTKDPGRAAWEVERDARILEQTRAKDARHYTNAEDARWIESARPIDLFKSWSASVAWRELDEAAADATDRVEERLAALYPEAMHRYRNELDAGNDASVAMAQAAQVLAATPQAVTTSTASAMLRSEPAGMTIGVARKPQPTTARRPASATTRRR